MAQDRITKRDLAGMLGRLERITHTHKIIGSDDRLTLITGSATFGNSYAVVLVDRGLGGHSNPFGTFHFGFTARECHDRMHALCVALEASTHAATGK